MSDPLADSPLEPTETAIILSTTPPNEPPPPYPSRERRHRARTGRRRRTLTTDITNSHTRVPSTGTESEHDSSQYQPFPQSDEEHGAEAASETTPLLSNPSSPRAPHRGPVPVTRERTLSLTSTLRSSASIANSFAQTILSAFNPERDSDLDADCDDHIERQRISGAAPTQTFAVESDHFISGQPRRTYSRSCLTFWRRYFRPVTKKAYYSSLFHLLVLNFPYALLAWIYLFVFTLTGTTTLMALPLGAVLCFLDLLGARFFARGELALQTTFHGPLGFPPPYPPRPIFTRTRPPTPAELEAGAGTIYERSFYRNAYAMFTDPTSYQALFYFLVIKPGITLLLSLKLIILVPISAVLIFPFPAVLRLTRRLGIWQANVAVEGLYYAVR